MTKYINNIFIHTIQMNYLNRNLEKLDEVLQGTTFEKFWGLDESIKIRKETTTEPTLDISINYSKTHFIEFKHLPIEISRIISEFLTDKIDIRTRIVYPQNYPFRNPEWTLLSVIHNSPKPLLDEYYREKIANHNCENREYWSPAIRMDKDILSFFITIQDLHGMFHMNES